MTITAQELDCLHDNSTQMCCVYVHKKSWEQQRQMYLCTDLSGTGVGKGWNRKKKVVGSSLLHLFLVYIISEPVLVIFVAMVVGNDERVNGFSEDHQNTWNETRTEILAGNIDLKSSGQSKRHAKASVFIQLWLHFSFIWIVIHPSWLER